MGTIVMPHVMLQVLSLCHVLCRRHYHHAAFCVVGAVIAWLWWASCCGHVCCVAMVGVIMLCCVTVRVVTWLQWVSLCHVVLQLGLLHGHGGCCHAMLCHGHDRCVT